jgi:hypothetical protein
MADEQADNPHGSAAGKAGAPPTASDSPGSGRRQSDRRKAQHPIDGPDRRQGDRRSGTDRRTAQRDPGEDEANGG